MARWRYGAVVRWRGGARWRAVARDAAMLPCCRHLISCAPPASASVVNGQPLVFLPCSGSELQSWTLDDTGSLFVANTRWQCIDVSNYGAGPRLDTYACAHSANQLWERRVSPTCSESDVTTYGIPCSQIVNPASGKCLTKVLASGASIGLDAGTTYTVAQALPCKPIGDASQIFDVVRGDQGGFPEGFPVRSYAAKGEEATEVCLQPYIAKEPEFDAIAFQTPDGGVSVVAMNKGEEGHTFTLYDATLGLGATEVVVPPHSIQSYKLPATTTTVLPSAGSTAALVATSTATALPGRSQPRGQSPLGGSAMSSLSALVVFALAAGALVTATTLIARGYVSRHADTLLDSLKGACDWPEAERLAASDASEDEPPADGASLAVSAVDCPYHEYSDAQQPTR